MWLSVSESAKHFQLSATAIRNRIYLLEVEAVRIGSEWRIWVEDGGMPPKEVAGSEVGHADS